MIRVALAEDQALLRAGLRGIIETSDDLVVVGEAGDGRSAVAGVREWAPDVVLMDVRMPVMDGIEATRLIVSTCPSVAVVVLTTFDLDEYVYGALRAGASGFLLKDVPPGELLTAIRVVAAGEALLAPRVTRRLIQRFALSPPPPVAGSPSLDVLTEREREVLALVAEGLSNAEIGSRLHITPGTAKTHVGHLLTKLNARDRVQLAITAFRAGLVSPPSRG